MAKGKRKAAPAAADQAPAAAANGTHAADADVGATASRPSTSGRPYTVSMAVCSSMIDNTQNIEFATFVAGQVARTAAIFCVDELVIVDDTPQRKDGTVSAGAAFLARVAQYLETPQYLRKALIPMHPDLRLAGLLPPLDAPHHMRASEWAAYREGLVLRSAPGAGSYVDIGLDRMAHVPQVIAPNTRVTLELGPQPDVQFAPDFGENMIQGQVVSPSAPREQAGLFWGYTVRLAAGVAGLVRGCPFTPGGGAYDLVIGTSEHGQAVAPGDLLLPRFKHVLIAFGGPEGLEQALAQDKKLKGRPPTEVFDLYLNTCPAQGSRTIRAEEAILISMAFLQTAVARYGGLPAGGAADGGRQLGANGV